MNVRLAEEKDNEHIFKIWQACFTDDKAYIDNYLKYCLPHAKTWLLTLENSEIVSCLSVIPSFVNYNNIIIKGGYLYAVGTLPEHRGNSFSKILMAAATKYCREDDFSYLIVKPADEKLFAFYHKNSFDKEIFKVVATFNTSKSYNSVFTPAETIAITPHELFVLRESSFVNYNFLWQEDILNYAILETTSRGGTCKMLKPSAFSCDLPIYYIAYPDNLRKNRIKVLETNAKTSQELSILISTLKQENPKMTEMAIDFPVNYMESQEFAVGRSALLLSFFPEIHTQIEKFHLSLPLE
jgi:ribosomal protein S18 acetylase RimI-like enzyme